MLWGNTTRPKFLGSANGQINKCFADPRGWVIRHDKGNGRYWDEILVGAAGFPAAGGVPEIEAVTFTAIVPKVIITADQAVSTALVPVGTIFFQSNGVANVGVGVVTSINAASNTFVMTRTSGRFNSANVLQSASVANVVISAANNHATGNVTAFFNERIVTTGIPTINVDSTTTANVSANLVSGNNTNQLVFGFTVLAGTASVISISANSMSANSGTVLDAANTSVSANLQFTAAKTANAAFGQSGKTLSI